MLEGIFCKDKIITAWIVIGVRMYEVSIEFTAWSTQQWQGHKNKLIPWFSSCMSK